MDVRIIQEKISTINYKFKNKIKYLNLIKQIFYKIIIKFIIYLKIYFYNL